MINIKTEITIEPITLEMFSNIEYSETHGGLNIFVGRVRSNNLGKTVTAIEYDCFQKLCLNIFNQIAQEAVKKWWPDAKVYIVHRHGRLLVGEISVLIAAATSHRDESYRITRYIIEEIKVRAPIWKKEFYIDGESDWVKGHALCQHRKVNHHVLNESSECIHD